MLYYSQGKGDTDEKVKTWKTWKFQNKKQQNKNKKLKQKGLQATILNKAKINNRTHLRLDNTAEREVNQRC